MSTRLQGRLAWTMEGRSGCCCPQLRGPSRGWVAGAADSRRWACHTVRTDLEPSFLSPSPSCFHISFIALVASLK